MILRNNSEKVIMQVRYIQTLNIVDKLKMTILVLQSDMIKSKIDKEKIIDLLQKYLYIFGNTYNKDRMIFFGNKMDIFILAQVMEMTEQEKENFVFEIVYDVYSFIEHDINC